MRGCGVVPALASAAMPQPAAPSASASALTSGLTVCRPRTIGDPIAYPPVRMLAEARKLHEGGRARQAPRAGPALSACGRARERDRVRAAARRAAPAHAARRAAPRPARASEGITFARMPAESMVGAIESRIIEAQSGLASEMTR